MSARLGGYELIRRIAVGGMAEVFLARKAGPEGFEKRVAIKRILPHLAGEEDFVRMFFDEARLAARLDHPHIVHIYDFGRDGKSWFLAMEHVAGVDAQALLRRAGELAVSLPLDEVATLCAHACEALHHAHERGVIHRDVTPANLLVSYDGVVKLADFGIAKAEARATRTQAGALKGKIAYMAPEQARGQTVDRRSDVYSLGVCAWELAAGRRLHAGAGELELLERVQAGDVPALSSVRPEVPPELDAIVARALARDPAARYQSARAFGEALGGWMAGHGASPSSARLGAYMTLLFGADAAARAHVEIPSEPTAAVAPAPRPLAARAWRAFHLPEVRFNLHLDRLQGRLQGMVRLPRLRLLLPLLAILLSGTGLLVAWRSPTPAPSTSMGGPRSPSREPPGRSMIGRSEGGTRP